MTFPATIAWAPGRRVRVLDQTLLPAEERYLDLASADDVAEAIRTLRVRGAPLIGIAAAMGMALEAAKAGAGETPDGLARARAAGRVLGATRPTAVNLQWAISRMLARAESAAAAGESVADALTAESETIAAEDRAMCERIGRLGAALLPDDAIVCTICNAGALATGGMGTALAVER